MKKSFPITGLMLLAMNAGAQIDEARQQELRYLLKQDCGSCHGLTLGGGLGPALLPGDLRGKPRQSIADTIYAGRPGTAMPPWKALLSREEAYWLAGQLLRGAKP